MRITRKMLDGLYATVATMATNRGVDTSNWSFGPHVSSSLWIAEVEPGSGGVSEISARWDGNQQAYYGLQGMMRAYMTIPRVDGKE
jgi:hypothetical protein